MTVDLITEVTKCLSWGRGSIYGMETLDKETIHISGGMEQDSVRFHHVSQNSV